MAGIGFELKKLFKDNSGILNALKGYSVTAVVTEGPMILTMLMLFLIRYIMKYYHASYKEQEIFLFMITYVMIFSLILSNTVLMLINRYISDCIYNEEMNNVLPSFFGVIFLILLIGGPVSWIYVCTLPVSWMIRIAAVWQFCSMLVLWIQMAYLSAIKQYTYVLLGFLAGTIGSVGSAAVMMGIGWNQLLAAMWGAAIGFLIMMVLFMVQMIAYYPMGEFRLFGYFPALDRYGSLVATGFLMAFGLYAHNFVFWFSEFRNQIFPTGVFCTRYDIPAFYATLTILPMLVQFVVSLETKFCKKNRFYFDTILYGGRLSEIQAAKQDMEKTLFRELAYMMEIQLIFTVFSVTFLGNFLKTIGLDEGMTIIYRILCFGYCIYGLMKCLIIILLYFDDRKGACISAGMFAAASIVLSALSLSAGADFWGAGFLGAGILTTFYTIIRLKRYLNRLEYHVFCEQPLFVEEKNGVFQKMEVYFDKTEQELKEKNRERVMKNEN